MASTAKAGYSMDKNWQGLDFLRGFGIFILLVMHSAFYYFTGLWDLDLANPPLIITVIGFLLMFAGLFAVISGAVHAISMTRLAAAGWPAEKVLGKKLLSSVFILAVAYLYFLLTGPGLSNFADRSMNNSILVELIRNGRLVGLNTERLLYVDSLVMIGCNILLVSVIWFGLRKMNWLKTSVLLGLSGLVMVLSLLRLPLYAYYLEQFEQGHWLQVLALFWLVNKNNPVLPFLAFGLLGAWLGLRLENGQRSRLPLFLGLALTVTGLVLYVFLPDTMLQRAIDLKWYSIMIAQMGIFLLMILGVLAGLDRRNKPVKTLMPVVRFFSRFSLAGLTAFFWESVVAALVWRGLNLFFPGLQLDIIGALIFGLCLALGWGFALMAWEKVHYVGSIEYFYGRVITRFGKVSSKAQKLRQ
jgi:hypothetical protein